MCCPCHSSLFLSPLSFYISFIFLLLFLWERAGGGDGRNSTTAVKVDDDDLRSGCESAISHPKTFV